MNHQVNVLIGIRLTGSSSNAQGEKRNLPLEGQRMYEQRLHRWYKSAPTLSGEVRSHTSDAENQVLTFICLRKTKSIKQNPHKGYDFSV